MYVFRIGEKIETMVLESNADVYHRVDYAVEVRLYRSLSYLNSLADSEFA